MEESNAEKINGQGTGHPLEYLVKLEVRHEPGAESGWEALWEWLLAPNEEHDAKDKENLTGTASDDHQGSDSRM